jgi:hypothetical protein
LFLCIDHRPWTIQQELGAGGEKGSGAGAVEESDFEIRIGLGVVGLRRVRARVRLLDLPYNYCVLGPELVNLINQYVIEC